NISLPPAPLDSCLKDDSSGAELVFSSVTGDYLFCCPSRAPIVGKGRLAIHGNIISLQQGSSETDRRLTATIDRGTGRATASLQSPVGRIVCTITDRNIGNNTCSCSGN